MTTKGRKERLGVGGWREGAKKRVKRRTNKRTRRTAFESLRQGLREAIDAERTSATRNVYSEIKEGFDALKKRRTKEIPAAIPAKPYTRKRMRDPKTAAAYLTVAAETGDRAAFLQAVWCIVLANLSLKAGDDDPNTRASRSLFRLSKNRVIGKKSAVRCHVGLRGDRWEVTIYDANGNWGMGCAGDTLSQALERLAQ